jgi:hypothetical protein
MKRTNAPPIPEGLRIELNGEQEWKDVMQVFEDAGWTWYSNHKPTDFVEEYSKCNLSVIVTEQYNNITRGSKTTEHHYTAAQFLQQYQGTIEYEVDDWVVLLKNQNGDPAGTITQVVKINSVDVNVKNVTRLSCNVETWSASTDALRPATPEEIASVTKVEPVAVNKPELYIWDGDVLPDEYRLQCPHPTPGEWSELMEKAAKYTVDGSKTKSYGDSLSWYKIENNTWDLSCGNWGNDIPIVPYELWKQILTTPDNQVEQPAVKERMFKKGDRVKVVRGSYEGCIGTVDDMAVITDALYWVNLDSGDRTPMFSGECGTGVDIVHYTEEPAVEKWSIVTTDGVQVYEGDKCYWYHIVTNQLGFDNGTPQEIRSTDIGIGTIWLLFSTFEAAEEYISKQKQPAGRKWKVGDRYCNPANMAVDIPNTEGWYIRQLSKDTYKMETVDGEDKMSRYSYTARQIDNYIKTGDWIPYSENKEKDDNTTNNKTKNQTTNNGNNKQQPQQDSYYSSISNNQSSYSTSVNLRTDPETICPGERRTTAAVCLCGQPEYIVR